MMWITTSLTNVIPFENWKKRFSIYSLLFGMSMKSETFDNWLLKNQKFEKRFFQLYRCKKNNNMQLLRSIIIILGSFYSVKIFVCRSKTSKIYLIMIYKRSISVFVIDGRVFHIFGYSYLVESNLLSARIRKLVPSAVVVISVALLIGAGVEGLWGLLFQRWLNPYEALMLLLSICLHQT